MCHKLDSCEKLLGKKKSRGHTFTVRLATVAIRRMAVVNENGLRRSRKISQTIFFFVFQKG